MVAILTGFLSCSLGFDVPCTYYCIDSLWFRITPNAAADYNSNVDSLFYKEFYDYFYTPKQIRKMKLNKIRKMKLNKIKTYESK